MIVTFPNWLVISYTTDEQISCFRGSLFLLLLLLISPPPSFKISNIRSQSSPLSSSSNNHILLIWFKNWNLFFFKTQIPFIEIPQKLIKMCLSEFSLVCLLLLLLLVPLRHTPSYMLVTKKRKSPLIRRWLLFLFLLHLSILVRHQYYPMYAKF